MTEWFGNRQFRQLIVLLVVVVSLSFSIVYSNVQTYDYKQAEVTGYSDSVEYIKMYLGEPEMDIGSYRPLVPFLARLVPDLPRWLFAPTRYVDYFFNVAIKFGILNFFFLICACLALYILQQGFGLNYLEAFLGVVLFLSSQTVVRSAGLPMVDAAFYFFFLLSAIAIQRNNLWLLFFAFTLGVLAKELVVILSIPLILLSFFSCQRKCLMFLTSIPAVLLHIWVRFTIAPSPLLDKVLTGWTLKYIKYQLLLLITPNKLINLFLSFGLGWIPAIYALTACKVNSLLRRWSWLILVVFIGVLLEGSNFARNTFSAFVVVIPLASLGLSKYLADVTKDRVA